MRLLPLLLIVLLLASGCLPRQPQSVDAVETLQQSAFWRFVDAESPSERQQALQVLQRDFPQNPLTARAVKLDAEEKARLELQAKSKKLSAELKRCKEEISQRETENAALRKDIEQFKQLVIEMEMRAR